MEKIQPAALKIIDEARKQLKITHEHIAERLGKERSVVTKMLSGKSGMRTSDLIKIANMLNLNTSQLITILRNETKKQTEDYDKINWRDLSDEAIEDLAEEIDEYDVDERGQLHYRGTPHDPGHVSSNGIKTKHVGAIAEVDVAAGAGEGALGEVVSVSIGDETYSGHPVVAEWVIPEEYATYTLGINVGRTLIIKVVGDSMAPTYQPGDRVIVDLRQRQLSVDGVYIISDGESPPQIKRLQRVLFSSPTEVDIVSDNPSHITQRVQLEFLHIIGRVAGKVTVS